MMKPSGLDKLVALCILIEALQLNMAAGPPEELGEPAMAGSDRRKPSQG